MYIRKSIFLCVWYCHRNNVISGWGYFISASKVNSSNLALKNKLNSLAAIKLHLVHAKLTEQVSLANKGFFISRPQ